MEKPNIKISEEVHFKLSEQLGTLCRIVHLKTGLFFNGYDEFYNSTKGKNTLSQTNFKSYMTFNKNDIEILEEAFNGHTKLDSEGKIYIRNEIVFTGSEIHKILSKYYDEYKYIPLKDFVVERLNQNKKEN